MGGHVAAYFSKSSMACGSSVYWITHVIMMFPFPRAAPTLGPGHLRWGRTIDADRTWEATDHARSRGRRKRADHRRGRGRGARASTSEPRARGGTANGSEPFGREI